MHADRQKKKKKTQRNKKKERVKPHAPTGTTHSFSLWHIVVKNVYLNASSKSLHQTGILGHTVEGRILRLQQLGWWGKLHNLALVKHDNLVRIHDGVQSVSDR